MTFSVGINRRCCWLDEVTWVRKRMRPPDQEEPDSQQQPVLVLVFVACAVAAVLMSRAIGTGLSGDELLYLRAIDLGPTSALMSVGSSHPPLGRWIVGAFFSTDSPDWALRLPSVLAAILTVVTWAFLLKRVFGDRRFLAVLIPLMALNKCWLEIGYQLVPYSMLTLFASIHCLAWLRLLEKATWDRLLVFAASVVAAVWTHFYGINLLIADQVIWGLLLWRNRSLLKLWWKVSAACLLFSAPVVPILLFYLDVEKSHSLVRIAEFGHYFIAESSLCFGSVTFNVPLLLPVILAWYFAVVFIVWKWLRNDRSHIDRSHAADVPANQSTIVFVGVFLAGFPAMQMHSLLSGEAMWERYVVYASWVHWPLMVLFVRRILSRRAAELAADGALAFSWVALVGIVGLGQHWTFDHEPVVEFMAEYAQPDDAFLAQDIDIFAGESSTYRLWFDRYSPVDLKIVTGPPMGRFELQDNGLPLDAIDNSVNRLWVYSDMYLWTEEKLTRSTEWRPIAKLTGHPRPPLVLLERVGTDGGTSSVDLVTR